MHETETIHCEHDGDVLEGFIAVPHGAAPHPAVLMFPGATGAGETFRAAVAELASLGYLTVGIGMYDRDANIDTPETAGREFMALLEAPEKLRERVIAWFETVATRSDVDPGRVAAIGYCFGGKCVLELARSGADVTSVTSFHGLLATHAPAQRGTVKAEVAAWCAGQDPFAPVEQIDQLRAELEAAGARHQITLFSHAQHSFTDPDHDGIQPGIAYDPLAHRIAWAGTLALLEQKLLTRD